MQSAKEVGMALRRLTHLHRPTESDIELCMRIWPVLRDAHGNSPEQYMQLADFANRSIEGFMTTLSQNSVNVEIDPAEVVGGFYSWIDKSRDDSIIALAEKLGWDIPPDTVHESRPLKHMLEIVAILSCMIRIKCDPPHGEAIPWDRDASLKAAIDSHWDRRTNKRVKSSTFSSLSEKDIFDDSLTVSNLVNNYGYIIVWTDYLDEHLSIDGHLKTISIYQHKFLLYAHLLSTRGEATGDATGNDTHAATQIAGASPDVLGECLDTLNLLFPYHDPATCDFLESHGHAFHRLGDCARANAIAGAGGAQHQPFPIWGRRLRELAAVVQGPPTRGLGQFVRAHPEGGGARLMDLVNFWIAVGIAALTVISFVFGLVATIYAKRGYDVALASLEMSREQYLLSLAQTCADPESPEAVVVQFC